MFPCKPPRLTHCATIPADCTTRPKCLCLNLTAECGPYGGICVNNDPVNGLVACF